MVEQAPVTATTKTAEVERPVLQDKPEVAQLPIFKNVWMVQVGTFSLEKNAYALRDKLRADGFDGHTKKIAADGNKVAIRVFTGPFVNRRDAEKIKKKLDQKNQVKSIILFSNDLTPYYPYTLIPFFLIHFFSYLAPPKQFINQ